MMLRGANGYDNDGNDEDDDATMVVTMVMVVAMMMTMMAVMSARLAKGNVLSPQGACTLGARAPAQAMLARGVLSRFSLETR